MSMRFRASRGIAATLLGLGIMLASWVSAQATPYTWTQTASGTQDWNTASNWSDNATFVSGAGNQLVFFADTTTIIPTTSAQTVINVPATLAMNTLTLNGKGPNNLSGFPITIGTNASTWTIGDGTTSTVNLNSTLGAGFSVANSVRDIRYTIAANLVLGGDTSGITTFTGDSPSGTGAVFSGNITETAAGQGITKSGTSLLIFSGNNSYTGPTLVSGGTLRLSSATALSGGIGATGGTSALTLNGGVVELAANDFQRNLGTGSSQFQISGGASGFSAFGGPRVVTVNDDASQELVWGSATFAPTTFVLNTAMANDSIELTNKLDLNGVTRTIQSFANKALLSGDIRNTGSAAGLNILGGGTLVLTGNNTYDGPTTIGLSSTLSVGAANNLGSSSSNLTWSGATLQITGTAVTSISGLGRTVTFSGSTKGFDIHNAANTFTVNQVLNQGSGALTKLGAGTLVLSADNTFTGATTVSGGGTLVLDYTANNGRKLGNAALNLNGGNLVLRGGSHAQAISSITLGVNTGNTISRDGGTATIANAGGITSVGNNFNLAIAEPGIVSTTTLNVNGIQALGRVTVGSDFATKDGSNLLQSYSIPVGNQYTAGAGVNAPTVVNQLTGGGTMTGTLSSYSLRIVNSGNSNVLDLGSNSLQVPDNGTVLYAGGADNNYTINGTGTTNSGVRVAAGTLSMNVFAGTLTVNARLNAAGSSSLVKSGAGTLVAAGNNDYSNPIYIQQGVLRAASSTALGRANSQQLTVVQAGAALELSNGITAGVRPLSLNGVGIANGGALRNHSGSNSYNGLITIGASGARINADASSSLTLGGGIVTTLVQDVTFGGAGNTTVATTGISGSGSLIKDGTGTLTLSAPNTYTGDTIVTGGTLLVNTTNGGGAVTVSALGTLGGNGTLGGFLTIASGGNLALTGATLGASSTGILSLADNLTLGSMTFQDLVGWDWLNADTGTYQLISGNFTVDFGATQYTSPGTAYDFGNGKSGYFTSGSLNAVVVVVPEPATMAVLGAGVAILGLRLARRRVS